MKKGRKSRKLNYAFAALNGITGCATTQAAQPTVPQPQSSTREAQLEQALRETVAMAANMASNGLSTLSETDQRRFVELAQVLRQTTQPGSSATGGAALTPAQIEQILQRLQQLERAASPSQPQATVMPQAPLTQPALFFPGFRTGALGNAAFRGPTPWEQTGAVIGRTQVTLTLSYIYYAMVVYVDGGEVCTFEGSNGDRPTPPPQMLHLTVGGLNQACALPPNYPNVSVVRFRTTPGRHTLRVEFFHYTSDEGIGRSYRTYEREIEIPRDDNLNIGNPEYMQM